jgi:hypothetical protein
MPWFVAALFLGLLTAWSLEKRASVRARAMLASVALPLLGYGWLLWSAARHGSNESYNAYKLFAVFHPLLLAGFCGWMGWTRRRGGRASLGWACACALLGVAWFGAAPVRAAIAQPRLRVDRELLDLRRIEGMADVASLNMVLEPFWARLWANALLLRKPQYFRTYTYETRRPTALRGEWNLRDRSIAVRTGDADERAVNGRYYLLRHGPRFVEAAPGTGWFPTERLGPTQWAWTSGVATLRVANPHPYPLNGSLRGRLRSIAPRDLALHAGGEPVWSGPVGAEEAPFATPAFPLPPGETTIAFVPSGPPAAPPGDGRALSVAVYDLEIVIDGGPGPAP